MNDKSRPLLTLDNHLKFGFNNTPFARRKSDKDRFFIQYGTCKRRPADFRSECIHSAKQIHFLAKKPIYLALSGGIDSEVMAEAFRQAEVPFKALICRFDKDKNIHDISWAIAYCEGKKIPYEFFDIDIEAFFSSQKFKDICFEFALVYPMLSIAMLLLEEVAVNRLAFPVIGSGEFLLRKIANSWFAVDSEPILSLFQFAYHRGISCAPAFFQWSPEQFTSIFRDPLVQKMIQGKESILTSEEIKPAVYSNYFKLEKRQKYFGFEKILQQESTIRKKLLNQFPGSETACLTTVDFFTAQL